MKLREVSLKGLFQGLGYLMSLLVRFVEKFCDICNFADDNTIYDCGEDLYLIF